MKRPILRVSRRFIRLRIRNSWNCTNSFRSMLWNCIKIWLVPISVEMRRRIPKWTNKTWNIDREVIRIKARNCRKYIRSRASWKYLRNMKMWSPKYSHSIWTTKRVNMINRRTMKRTMKSSIRDSWIRFKEKTFRWMISRLTMISRLIMMWMLLMIWTLWTISMKVSIELTCQAVERISSE